MVRKVIKKLVLLCMRIDWARASCESFGFDIVVVCLSYNGWFENPIKGS